MSEQGPGHGPGQEGGAVPHNKTQTVVAQIIDGDTLRFGASDFRRERTQRCSGCRRYVLTGNLAYCDLVHQKRDKAEFCSRWEPR